MVTKSILEVLFVDDTVSLDKVECVKYGVKTAYVHALIKQNPNYTIDYLAETTNFSKKTINKCLDLLINENKITLEVLEPQVIKSMSLKLQKDKKCEWCNEYVAFLEEHHYPIPKRNGGDKVVSICPNCHTNFHKLETSKNRGWV